MTQTHAITPTSIVDDLLTHYPATAPVFVRRRLACVGCDLARFDTIADVCAIYQQSLDDFLDELRSAAMRDAY